MLVKTLHHVRSAVHDRLSLVLRIFGYTIACKSTHLVFVNESRCLYRVHIFVLHRRKKRLEIAHQVKRQAKPGAQVTKLAMHSLGFFGIKIFDMLGWMAFTVGSVTFEHILFPKRVQAVIAHIRSMLMISSTTYETR